MKIKIMFMESWFKAKDGTQWYKAHFQLTQDLTAWVPVSKKLDAGSELTLRISRDKEGRAKISAVV